MKLKIQKLEDVPAPAYAKEGDAGLDFYSAEEIVLKPGERAAVRTGLKIAVPDGYVGLIWDKSGLALNNGIKTMAGVVDTGYRGEIKIVLINLGKEEFVIKKNSKIAQMIIQKVERVEIEEVDFLDETARGEGGFGSTSLN